MPSSSNPQTVLKPQDLVVLLKLATLRGSFTYAALARELFLSASELHASVVRAKAARLVAPGAKEEMQVVKGALHEFLVHGARYAFPPVFGPLTRGMPTAYAAPVLREGFVLPNEPNPVWPYSKGEVRGVSLQPLFPSVPQAAERDVALYEGLALLDAIRIGAARERDLAANLLKKLLA
jgi:hypothetical protein